MTTGQNRRRRGEERLMMIEGRAGVYKGGNLWPGEGDKRGKKEERCAQSQGLANGMHRMAHIRGSLP